MHAGPINSSLAIYRRDSIDVLRSCWGQNIQPPLICGRSPVLCLSWPLEMCCLILAVEMISIGMR